MASPLLTGLKDAYSFTIALNERYFQLLNETVPSALADKGDLENLTILNEKLSQYERVKDQFLAQTRLITEAESEFQLLYLKTKDTGRTTLDDLYREIANNKEHQVNRNLAKTAILTLTDNIAELYPRVSALSNALEQSLERELQRESNEEQIQKIPDSMSLGNQLTPHPSAPDTNTLLAQLVQLLSQSAQPNRTVMVQPQTFSLPKFDGKPENFKSYWARFNRMVHDNPAFSVIEKVNYLCESLQGEAVTAIRGIEPSSDTYELLRSALLDEYDHYSNDRYQILKNLQRLPQASNRSESCLKTLREIKSLFRQLAAAGAEASLDLCFLEVPSKFPFFVVSNILTERQTITTVTEFLSKLTEKVELLKMREESEQMRRQKGSEEKHFDKRNDEWTRKTPYKEGVQSSTCVFCDQNGHRSFQCKTCTTAKDKRSAVQKKNLCWVCLSKTHRSRDCVKEKCRRCQGDHHTFLCLKDEGTAPHRGTIQPTNVAHVVTAMNQLHSDSYMPDNSLHNNQSLNHIEDTRNLENCQIILRTAVAKVYNYKTNTYMPVNILIDEGSMRSFISEKLAQNLGLPISQSKTRTFYGIGGIAETHLVNEVETVFSTRTGHTIVTYLYTKPKLTTALRNPKLSKRDIQFIKEHKLTLANPHLNGEEFIPDILLGMDRYRIFMQKNEEMELPSCMLLKGTVFGHVLCGASPYIPETEPQVALVTILDSNVKVTHKEDMISQLYELEGLGINTDNSSDEQTIDYYAEYSKRITMQDGRIRAPFPMKEGLREFGNNRAGAYYRFQSLWKRLQTNEKEKEWYQKIIKEYLTLDIIEQVTTELHESISPQFYLPHHGVWKEGKSKPLRIVFDASAKQKGSVSLNDAIQTGLSFVHKVHDIIIACRMSPIIVTCDIESAFLQILIPAEHRDLCRFFWIQDPSAPPTGKNTITYRFKRLPFGITASPSVLNMCISWFLEQQDSPIAKEILELMYVDNIILMANTVDEAKQKCGETKRLFKLASMNVREFLSNESQVTQHMPEADLLPLTHTKILGIPFNTVSDKIGVEIQIPLNVTNTKRGMLKQLHSVYDPIGIVNPVLLPLKLLFREICTTKLGWDDLLPEHISSSWLKIIDEINDTKFETPRIAVKGTVEKKLWVFADASQIALATCAYLQSKEMISTILNGKSRLSPKSNITIPRLELLAIRLATRLADSITKILKFKVVINIVSDSMIALSWIKGSSKDMPAFLRNQLRNIRNTLNELSREQLELNLYHVDTKYNPADLGSRGGTISEVSTSMWVNGPQWLLQNITPLTMMVSKPKFVEGQEPQLVAVHTEPTIMSKELENNLALRDKHKDLLSLLVRVGKICKNWYYKIKNPRELKYLTHLTDTDKYTIADQEAILELLLRQSQEHLSLKVLEKNYKGFSFFTDEVGLIRVKSRLQLSKLPYNAKNPVFVPRESPLAGRLIMHFHRRSMHQGKDYVQAMLRQYYYIPRSSTVVRKVLRTCTVCNRLQSLPYGTPSMPSLPKDRVILSHPFDSTGVDLMGPLLLKTQRKVYICLFTCMTTRAVHLELVQNLSGTSFLNAFDRFISRRGVPSIMRSDCGSNFILGAKVLETPMTEEEMISHGTKRGIKWIFNTPLSPWKGGCWERLIGIVKKALQKALGNKKLSRDELMTILVKIELIVNTRPLTHPDPNDLSKMPIRPIDFINPSLSFSLPESNTTRIYDDDEEVPTIASVEQAVEAIHQISKTASDFWTAFELEYLTHIRDIYKHTRAQPRKNSQVPTIGEVVTVQKDNLPRGIWRIGKITELIKSPDNEIRSARVLMASGNTLTRSLNHLYPLEIRCKDPSVLPNSLDKEVDDFTVAVGELETPVADTNTGEESMTPDRVDEKQPPVKLPETINSDIFIPVRRARRFRSASSHHRPIQLPYRSIRNTFRTTRNTPTVPQRLRYHSIPKYTERKKGIHSSIAQAIGTALGFLVIEKLLPTVNGDTCNGTAPFTTHLLANPHCDEHMSIASLFIPILIFLGIIACVARLLRSEHRTKSISTFIRTRRDIEKRKIGIPLNEEEIEKGNATEYEEEKTSDVSDDKQTNETQKRFLKLPNYMNLGSRISLTILLTMMIGRNIQACDDAHIVHTTSFKCVNLTHCYQEYDNQMILSRGTHKACISMKFKNTTVGMIEIEKSRTEYRCIKNLKYFTRQTKPKITTTRKCSSFGSCDDTCRTIDPRIKIKEFEEHQEGPFQIGCQNSCGFLFCGCITWSDSCSFYIIEHIATSDEIYETFVCDQWEPIVNLKISANIFNQNTEMNLALRPYEKYTHSFFNMSIISQINIQTALYNKLFLASNRSAFLVDRHETPTVLCESEHQAANNFSQCLVSKYCDCNVNKNYQVACNCPNPEIYQSQNMLPLNVEEMSIEQNEKQIKLYPKNDETTIALDSAILMTPSSFYFDYPCKADVIEVTGCYACLRGASVKIECLTSIKSNVLLVCSSQTFSITCSPAAFINTIIIHWENSILSESCYLTCSGERKELKIHGNLHWNPDIPYPSWVNDNDHAKQVGPDYTPLWEVISHNWKQVLCYLIGTFIISVICYTYGLICSLLFVKWALKGFFNCKETLLKFYHSWKTALRNDSMA